MSRTLALAEELLEWYRNIPDTHLRYPEYRLEALQAVSSEAPYDALHCIVKNGFAALCLITGAATYIDVYKGHDGNYYLTEVTSYPRVRTTPLLSSSMLIVVLLAYRNHYLRSIK